MSAVIQGQMALILVSALPVLMSLYPVPVLIPAQSVSASAAARIAAVIICVFLYVFLI